MRFKSANSFVKSESVESAMTREERIARIRELAERVQAVKDEIQGYLIILEGDAQRLAEAGDSLAKELAYHAGRANYRVAVVDHVSDTVNLAYALAAGDSL